MSAPAIFTDLNDVDRDGCMQEHKDEGGLAKHGVSIHEDTPWSLTSHPSRRHQVWTYFKQLNAKPHPDAACLFCGARIDNGQPNRNLVRHILLHCPLATPSAKFKLQTTASCSSVAIPYDNASTTSAQMNENGGQTFDQTAFEMGIARFFYAAAIPFALVEAPEFRSMFTNFPVDVRLPPAKSLGGKLLVVAKEACALNVIETIRNHGCVSLVTDVWTDVNSSSIMTFVVAAPTMPSLYWSSIPASTTDSIEREIGRVINEVQEVTGATLAVVVAGNSPNMNAAYNGSVSNQPVLGGGCAAHVINLLIRGIFSRIQVLRHQLWHSSST